MVDKDIVELSIALGEFFNKYRKDGYELYENSNAETTTNTYVLTKDDVVVTVEMVMKDGETVYSDMGERTKIVETAVSVTIKADHDGMIDVIGEDLKGVFGDIKMNKVFSE